MLLPSLMLLNKQQHHQQRQRQKQNRTTKQQRQPSHLPQRPQGDGDNLLLSASSLKLPLPTVTMAESFGPSLLPMGSIGSLSQPIRSLAFSVNLTCADFAEIFWQEGLFDWSRAMGPQTGPFRTARKF